MGPRPARAAIQQGRQTVTLTPARGAKQAGPRRRPRRRFAQNRPETLDRPERPASATEKPSPNHPAALAAGQILPIHGTVPCPTAGRSPPNPHRPNRPHYRA
jgi:hypothetical protein